MPEPPGPNEAEELEADVRALLREGTRRGGWTHRPQAGFWQWSRGRKVETVRTMGAYL